MINLVKLKGKPIEKLIEVIGKGVGQLYKPIAIKKEAKAEAYKIEIIENAKLKALMKRKDIEQDIMDRIEERVLHRELRYQKNLDSINLIAAQELQSENDVSDEEVDEDWIYRFFSHAQEISTEEMQTLWGKILAGEVKSPGSFSMRTLEILRNLSKSEAEIFQKFSQLSIKGPDTTFTIYPRDKYLEEIFDISFTDIMTMDEAGLMYSNELEITFSGSVGRVGFVYSNNVIVVNRQKNTPDQVIRILSFTTSGIQLLKLIDVNFNESYAQKFAELVKNPKVKVGYAEIKSKENKNHTYSEPLVDITVK